MSSRRDFISLLGSAAAAWPLANYTEAFTVGNLIFAAGQLASDFVSGVPAIGKKDPAFPFYGSDIKKQTRYILELPMVDMHTRRENGISREATPAGSEFSNLELIPLLPVP